MSLEDKETLQKAADDKARQLLGESSFLDQFFSHTLNSFSYRYFVLSNGLQAKAEKIDQNKYRVLALENDMKTAIQNASSQTKKSIIEMAKTVPKKSNPSVENQILIEVAHYDERGPCQINLFVQTSWNHPNHPLKNKNSVSMKKVVDYSESLLLRNQFAKDLEELCAGFFDS